MSILSTLRYTLAVLVVSILLVPFAQSTRTAAQSQERGLNIKVGATKSEIASGAKIELWAVVIGVSRYKYGDQDIDGNQFSNLKHAAEDADTVREFLMSPDGGAFPENHIFSLQDEEATKANVETALAKLKALKPNDFFVIYIAAHGANLPIADARTNTTTEIPFFLLYDTDLRIPEKTALRMEAFKATVDSLEAKKGLVLSDTCYSGGVQLMGRGVDDSVATNQRYLDLMNKIPQGVGFISAARANERSYESNDFNHGVFTYWLIDGLRGNADSNQDSKVTFQEVVDYLEARVPPMTGNRQHPFANTNAREAYDLALSAVTYAEDATKGPAGEYGSLTIAVPDLDGVNVAIDDKAQGELRKGIVRTFRVSAGQHRVLFARDKSKREWSTKVEPGQTRPFTVNFAFSESGTADDSLIDPGEQVNLYLPPEIDAPKAAQDLFLQGVGLFNKQDYQKAIEKFNQANDKFDSKYAEALVYRGRAEQSLNKDREAIKSFQKALQLRPSDFETRTLLAEAQFKTVSNLDDVDKDLKEVIAAHPDFAYAHIVRAAILTYLEKFSAAQWELRLAINSNPGYPAAYLELADALTYDDRLGSLNKQKEAIKMAEKALDLYEKVSQKKVKLSTGLKHLSISHVIFGHAKYSDNNVMAEAHHMLGKTRTRLVQAYSKKLSPTERSQSLDSARTELNIALSLAQKLPEKRRLTMVLETSAENHRLNGEFRDAIEDGNKALKLSTQYPDMKEMGKNLHLTLSAAYEGSQDYAKAADCLTKYIEAGELSADELANRKAEIENLRRKARANGQIK